MKPVEIFFSYAHEDEALMNKVRQQLVLYEREGYIIKKYDRDIRPGQEWEDVLDEDLNHSKIILLFASPDFIESQYCYNIEMKIALHRHETRDAIVIPIILRPCVWQNAPFGKLQVLPKDGKPITEWDNLDRVTLNVAEEIMKIVKELNNSSKPIKETKKKSIVKKDKQIKISALKSTLRKSASENNIRNSSLIHKFTFDEHGKLLLDDGGLFALSSEILFALSNGEKANINIEFMEIINIENMLNDLNKYNLSSDERIARVMLLEKRKDLLDRQRLLINALEITLYEPSLLFVRQYDILASVIRGFGEILLGRHYRTGNDIYVLLDLWQDSNSKIYTKVIVDLNDESEKQAYRKLIGEGWHLDDVPLKARYEYIIPAIILKYIELFNNKELESSNFLLNIYKWNIGLA